ncbi:MAG: UDP-N-acetylglucosamine 2-epimerase [Acidobacteriota bacterium]|nr:UDP-N-acetylglucosamine 2-epimerase [Acidobacteriota bacterium]
MRTIGVVTTSRADYGIYLPVLREIESAPGMLVRMMVSGSHLAPEFGMTVRAIEDDGFAIGDRIEVLLSSDTPEATVKSMALGLLGFAQSFGRQRPDVLLVLGDRFEMHAAALAALPFRIPVAHIHGGEVTLGAFDDALRHSLTKLSHLHFVATEEHARRVRQLGEEAWRVTVSGAPALDHLGRMTLLSVDEVERQFGLRLGRHFVLATFHPATLDAADPAEQVGALLTALEGVGLPVVITMPNADPGGRAIRAVIQARAERNQLLQPIENLGTQSYFSLMATADVLVGNSSSGIIEAASFGLPVVNIGSRQDGRTRGRNVVDVDASPASIAAGLARALTPAFKAGLAGGENPYGDGRAAERIVARLQQVDLGAALTLKAFVDSR